MNDLYQYFGQDLTTTSQGDLLLANGLTLSQQRILRRLLTNPGTYIFDLTYGAGLPQFVGQALSISLYNKIKGLITSNMYLETSVSQNPPPDIILKASQNSLFVQIEYTEAATTQLQVLSFTVS